MPLQALYVIVRGSLKAECVSQAEARESGRSPVFMSRFTKKTSSMQKISVYQPETRLLSALDSMNLTTWVSESLEHESRFLLVDFRRVLFMDSKGLGALLIAHNRVEKAGGHLGFCGLSGQARMLLDLSNMSQVLHIYESREAFQSRIQNSLNVA